MKAKKNTLFILFILLFLPVQKLTAEELSNFINMKFVKIPAGEFVMGLSDRDKALLEIKQPKMDDLLDELPAHKVKISKPFYIGKTEVTQKQWYQVMENRPGDTALWKRDDWKVLPVSSISWFMAARFVEEINKMDKVYTYRLPTEAEWEYVAKSGSNELRPVNNKLLDDHAWYIENSNDIVQPVATKNANSYGVHDMLGNVWEWVGDWYDKDIYKQSNRQDSQGPSQGRSKVRRGGSFHCPLYMIRPGYRSANEPGTRYEVIGFRVIAEYKK